MSFLSRSKVVALLRTEDMISFYIHALYQLAFGAPMKVLIDYSIPLHIGYIWSGVIFWPLPTWYLDTFLMLFFGVLTHFLHHPLSSKCE